MEDDGYQPTDKHEHIQAQVCAAGLQSFTVQRFALTRQTGCCDFRIGEDYTADRG